MSSVILSVYTKVRVIEKRFNKKWISGHGSDAIFETEDLGYYAWFEGSFEALYVGETPPNWEAGDRIKITFTKEPPNANTPYSSSGSSG